MPVFEQERVRIREEIWSLLDLNPGHRVLDVGVGHTAHSRYKLIELGTRTTSIDLDWPILHKHRTVDANSVQSNAAQMPFRRQIFELSLANFTFHEIDPLLHKQAMSELRRVSKRIMIAEPALGEDLLCKRFQDIWTESMHGIKKFEDYKPADYWIGILKVCGVEVTLVEKFPSRIRLRGQEAKDYMKTVIDNLREEGVPDKYVDKMLVLARDVVEKGMIFYDVNVMIGRA